jgi:cytochrome c-type biogenesis protein CcmH
VIGKALGVRWARPLATLALVLLVAAPSLAVQPDEMLPDAKLESRAREISTGLRCLICQNQTIDDSDAPVARDLRLLVRERLKAGDSDDQVRSFVVQRYGEFVLLKPVFQAHTLLLWLTPLLILAAGGLGIAGALRRNRRRAAATLTTDEREALDAVLERERGPSA